MKSIFFLFSLLSISAIAQPRAQIKCNAFNNDKPIIVNDPLDYWLTGTGVPVGYLYYAQTKQIGRIRYFFRGINKPKAEIDFFDSFTYDLRQNDRSDSPEKLGSSRFETKVGTSINFSGSWQDVSNPQKVKAEFKNKVSTDITLFTANNTYKNRLINIDSLLNSQVTNLKSVAQRIKKVERTYQYLVLINEVIATDTLGFQVGDIRSTSGSTDVFNILNTSINVSYNCNALTRLQSNNGEQRNVLYTVTYFDLDKLRDGIISLAVEYRPENNFFVPSLPNGITYADDFEIRQ